jgi:hypothetical protein
MLEGFRLIKKVGGLYKGVLSTKFVKKYPLTHLDEAIKYYLKNMSEGKVILTTTVTEVEDMIKSPNAAPTPKL